MEYRFQSDADLLRLEHLEYWSGLIEDYHKAKGVYPLQDRIQADGKPVLVRILSQAQQQYAFPDFKKYNEKHDNNSVGTFNEVWVTDFIKQLSVGLGRSIDEKYDMQQVPTTDPLGYYYFSTNDGYLIWTPCITCDVTKISTLLLNGYTPTVNITSAGMKDKVTKALTRSEMLLHPTFRGWKGRKYGKVGHVREIEAKFNQDSKNPPGIRPERTR